MENAPRINSKTMMPLAMHVESLSAPASIGPGPFLAEHGMANSASWYGTA
jgi:hypothetical protein